jgi:thiol:disulfide interchange protein DsbA
MEKAKKLAIAYQVTGVPVLVINGKYRLDLGSAGGMQQAVALADHLIARERAAQ